MAVSSTGGGGRELSFVEGRARTSTLGGTSRIERNLSQLETLVFFRDICSLCIFDVELARQLVSVTCERCFPVV